MSKGRVFIPAGQYFSPCMQMKRFIGLQEKYGDDAITSRKFQWEREAWIAAAFLLGYSMYTGQDWWLANPNDPSTDVIAIAISDGEKGNRAERLNIEIFEYGSILKLIRW